MKGLVRLLSSTFLLLAKLKNVAKKTLELMLELVVSLGLYANSTVSRMKSFSRSGVFSKFDGLMLMGSATLPTALEWFSSDDPVLGQHGLELAEGAGPDAAEAAALLGWPSWTQRASDSQLFASLSVRSSAESSRSSPYLR